MKTVCDLELGSCYYDTFHHTKAIGNHCCMRSAVSTTYLTTFFEANEQTFVNELLAEPDPNDEEDHVIPSHSI